MKSTKIINRDKWVWMGHPAHFIGGTECRFHMATKVGKYIISTVGEYAPNGEVKDIGWDRKYETMVFNAVKGKEKCCPWIQGDGSELDMNGYKEADAALKGHMKMCEKWAKK